MGQAFSFNGSNQYVRVPANANLPHGSAARTVSMWVYTRSTSWVPDQNTIFQSGVAGTTHGSFSLDMDNYPNMQFYTWNDDIVFNSGAALEGWIHIAMVYDGGTGTAVYVNGLPKSSKTLSGPLNTAVADLQIGAINYPGVLTSFFDGLVDEVQVYNRALSASEVATV